MLVRLGGTKACVSINNLHEREGTLFRSILQSQHVVISRVNWLIEQVFPANRAGSEFPCFTVLAGSYIIIDEASISVEEDAAGIPSVC